MTMKNQVIEFFHFNNRPVAEPSPAGEEIYNFEYFDEETNKIEKQSVNVYERIQSHKQALDYKRQIEIEKGESENGAGVYLDISKLGNSYASVDDYVAAVADAVKKAMASAETANPGTESSESGAESSESGAENRKETVQTEQKTGKTSTDTNTASGE